VGTLVGFAACVNALDGVRVFVTGHTGFKGSWAIAFLHRLGASVVGYALPAPTSPSLFEEAQLASTIDHHLGDVRDAASLLRAMRDAAPDVVLHLAAQSLVLQGMADPVTTYATNVMGTVNVLEAVRTTRSVRAVLVVTSDKCYEPSSSALREGDPLGGHDPYSASKACAEMVVAGYRPLLCGPGSAIVATARAGNVIGGGDWAANRLFADLARAAGGDRRVVLRHPGAVRPWQYVLDALAGYASVIRRALDGDASVARAWNFGPDNLERVTVGDIVELFETAYGEKMTASVDSTAVAENPALLLDSTAARERLGWHTRFDLLRSVRETAGFYRRRFAGEDVAGLLHESVTRYLEEEPKL
jgi:CDP-glucose 4,6-dehydratase